MPLLCFIILANQGKTFYIKTNLEYYQKYGALFYILEWIAQLEGQEALSKKPDNVVFQGEKIDFTEIPLRIGHFHMPVTSLS